METIRLRVTGAMPLLMHNARLANPLDADVKKHKLLTTKRKKTDEDHQALARSEFELGLYFDAKLGPYLPAENLRRSIIEGGRLSKLGTAIDRAVLMDAERIPLQYKGPRTIDGLWAESFYDLSSVGVQTSRTMRCRPRFAQWACELTAYFDGTMINRDQLVQAATAAGKFVGVGDYRPRFGRYEVEVLS